MFRIRDLGESLDAHRKRQQSAFPSLTVTDMDNVLAKLRSGEELSAKDRGVHQPLLVDGPILRRQFLAPPQLPQHVVHVGDGQRRKRRLLPLAVSVEGFAEIADSGRLLFRTQRKRKWQECFVACVTWIISDTKTPSGGQREEDVWPA